MSRRMQIKGARALAALETERYRRLQVKVREALHLGAAYTIIVLRYEPYAAEGKIQVEKRLLVRYSARAIISL